MKKTYTYLLCLLLLLGCQNDDPLPKVTDPKEAILGKWELIGNTYGPVDKAPGYFEYLSDSTLLFFSYTEKITYQEEYWLNDSLLFRSFEYADEYDTTKFLLPHKFEFLNYNKLKLELQIPAVNPVSIYKRLN